MCVPHRTASRGEHEQRLFTCLYAGVMRWRNLIGQKFKSFVVLESEAGSDKTFSRKSRKKVYTDLIYFKS